MLHKDIRVSVGTRRTGFAWLNTHTHTHVLMYICSTLSKPSWLIAEGSQTTPTGGRKSQCVDDVAVCMKKKDSGAEGAQGHCRTCQHAVCVCEYFICGSFQTAPLSHLRLVADVFLIRCLLKAIYSIHIAGGFPLPYGTLTVRTCSLPLSVFREKRNVKRIWKRQFWTEKHSWDAGGCVEDQPSRPSALDRPCFFLFFLMHQTNK